MLTLRYHVTQHLRASYRQTFVECTLLKFQHT